jgi:hypothetical protein
MLVKETADYRLNSYHENDAPDNPAGRILRFVSDEASGKLTMMELAHVGINIIMNVVYWAPPEMRSRIKEQIKRDFLSAIVDAEEYADKTDGGA